MPRLISSKPWPSGLGSPATTFRRSATSASGKSRSQFRPNQCLPSWLAPAAKSLIMATERSIKQGIAKSFGPKEPGWAPVAAWISASLAKVSGLATCGRFSALISLRVWSPRTTKAINWPSSAAWTTKVFTVFSIARPNCWTKSSMVLVSGVSTKRNSSLGAGRSVSRGIASAFSMLAA